VKRYFATQARAEWFALFLSKDSASPHNTQCIVDRVIREHQLERIERVGYYVSPQLPFCFVEKT